jgi:hypothetical protein
MALRLIAQPSRKGISNEDEIRRFFDAHCAVPFVATPGEGCCHCGSKFAGCGRLRLMTDKLPAQL